MAIVIPRVYLAFALPAVVVVLTYIWLKKRKDEESNSDLNTGDDSANETKDNIDISLEPNPISAVEDEIIKITNSCNELKTNMSSESFEEVKIVEADLPNLLDSEKPTECSNNVNISHCDKEICKENCSNMHKTSYSDDHHIEEEDFIVSSHLDSESNSLCSAVILSEEKTKCSNNETIAAAVSDIDIESTCKISELHPSSEGTSQIPLKCEVSDSQSDNNNVASDDETDLNNSHNFLSSTNKETFITNNNLHLNRTENVEVTILNAENSNLPSFDISGDSSIEKKQLCDQLETSAGIHTGVQTEIVDNVDTDNTMADSTKFVKNDSDTPVNCAIKKTIQPILEHEMEPKVNTSNDDEKAASDSKVSGNETSESIVNVQLSCSDAQSEGSSDSGKGGSEIHASHESSANNSQPNSPMNSDISLVYEFEIPQELCGRLIGRQGKQISQIRNKSHCNIYIRKIPFKDETQICVMEGLQSEIDIALEQIRYLFPLKKYPRMTLVQVNVPMVTGMTVPQTIQLNLPDGVMSDVILSSMVNAGHFFVQQPTHPTYPSLSRLDQCMISCYGQMNTPPLPTPIEPGMICAAPTMGGWYRAQIMFVDEETEECSLKFVDYGGYSQVKFSTLRQIRSDFMPLPFQAAECYLANVSPKNESEGFSVEACAIFEELAQGQILQLQIVGYAEDGCPCVNLYRIQGISTVFINEELCRRGAAQWIEDQTS